MKPILTTLFLASCLVGLAGCDASQYGDEEAASPYEADATAESEAGTPSEDVSGLGAEMAIDDVTLGKEIGADGSIPADAVTDDFAPGTPVHVAMEVGDTQPGESIRVVFLSDDDRQVHQETKSVQTGEQYLSFQADTANWQLGDYRVEVWMGDERVATEHFQVVEPDQAG